MKIVNNIEYVNSLRGENSIQSLKNISKQKPKNDDQLKDVCNEFEAIFLNQIFKQMRNSVKSLNSNPLLDGGFAEEVFKDMLYEEYSKIVSKYNSIGLSDIVYNYLKGK